MMVEVEQMRRCAEQGQDGARTAGQGFDGHTELPIVLVYGTGCPRRSDSSQQRAYQLIAGKALERVIRLTPNLIRPGGNTSATSNTVDFLFYRRLISLKVKVKCPP